MNALVLLFATLAHAGADNSCPLNYPKELHSPAVERWASNSLLTNEGTQAVECDLVSKLSGEFLYLQNEFAKYNNGKPMRGTHAKGICTNGTIQSYTAVADITAEQRSALLETGLFGTTQPVRARLRFANADSLKLPDWKADVRALSIKAALPNGGEQDFAFNNVPRFQIPNLDTFLHVMEMQHGLASKEITTDPVTGEPKDLFGFFSKTYGKLHAGAYLLSLLNVKKMADADKKWHTSYSSQTFWSTSAFAIGKSGKQIAKFGARPCVTPIKPVLASEEEAKEFSKGSENYLSEGLVKEMTAAPVCFNIFVQFLDEETSISSKSQAVEDPSLVWNAPIHDLGKILVNEAVDEQTCDDPRNGVNITANSSGIVGLGQINRARTFVEEASRTHR